jgi:hypothetical protein
MQTAYRFAISGVSSGILLALALVPYEWWASGPVICLYRNLLDVECFGCGLTRALAAAAHGDWSSAVASNGLVVVALPALFAGTLLPWKR